MKDFTNKDKKLIRKAFKALAGKETGIDTVEVYIASIRRRLKIVKQSPKFVTIEPYLRAIDDYSFQNSKSFDYSKAGNKKAIGWINSLRNKKLVETEEYTY